MRIIISPAKKMKVDTDLMASAQMPQFINESEQLLSLLQTLSYDELKALWKCNDAIAELNMERIRSMNVKENLTPAIYSYEGIQYQYMAPGVFQQEELAYLEQHLRILSGLYGMLRPLDGVTPYRLEMQGKLQGPGFKSLYQFWGSKLADQLQSESNCILNLASKEYSKNITPFLKEETRFVTCVFGQMVGGKLVEKATRAKMARGEMVRYMAELKITDVEDIKGFDRLAFVFSEELSDESTYVFVYSEEK
ncbi:peroxide stress protein YaaA [Paenibacillus polysaccharolyticus]|uniref:peroxide stress protein YaaA n=1 Tax=Paenibacillus polysaccharolyticus TaxID=582692 RepID=UPI00209EEC06|nr:peroxide stress protein YaaA [Paenibacillus polysaccharolyticus]MCP1132897.1 peroxide stress protein YaaA [Paenibacillus polysaccharolyticus]